MLNDFYELPVNERWVYVLIIGLVVGLVLGIFMRRESLRRMPVYGGAPAQLFHYLASATISGFVPVIFIALISEMPFLRIVGSALIFQAATLVLVTCYAVFENGAQPIQTKPVLELD